MISGLGKGDSLARTAIEAALQRQSAKLREMQQRAAELGSAESEAPRAAGFGSLLEQTVGAADAEAKKLDHLHLDVLQGKLDIHEAATRIQQSKLAFDFTMQVRDRFIDAYREVMRMSV